MQVHDFVVKDFVETYHFVKAEANALAHFVVSRRPITDVVFRRIVVPADDVEFTSPIGVSVFLQNANRTNDLKL